MNPNKPPMKNNQKSSPRVSALQITFISLLAVFLTLSGAPAQKRLEKKPTGANIALQSAQEEDLTSPVGLKPVEQGAWLAMAQRQRKTAIMDDPSWTATGSMNTARYDHSATLLPSGKILVAGGFGMTTAELFDPATGTWTAAGLPTARQNHTATLLPSGKVLVAAGHNSSGSLSSAELYDQGLGFDPNWQPLLTMVSPSILQSGSPLTASGSRFKGISEASGGNGVGNSSSNYPLIQLLSLTNEQTLFLLADTTAGWSDTSFTSTPITLMTTSSSGFPVGYALVTVFTNGIPSQSQFILGAAPTPGPIMPSAPEK